MTRRRTRESRRQSVAKSARHNVVVDDVVVDGVGVGARTESAPHGAAREAAASRATVA